MRLSKNILIAVLMTLVTTVIFGLIYPLVVTGLAQVIFPDRANGQLLTRNGHVVGSAIIGQAFSSPKYFHSRPSAAGTGYDAANSSGTNLGPTNKALIDAVKGRVDDAHKDNPTAPVPVDLVTSSGSGLDPHISPAAADFQVPRVARERAAAEDAIRRLVADFTEGRQLGFLGEARVNVLLLNLALDEAVPQALNDVTMERDAQIVVGPDGIVLAAIGAVPHGLLDARLEDCAGLPREVRDAGHARLFTRDLTIPTWV